MQCHYFAHSNKALAIAFTNGVLSMQLKDYYKILELQPQATLTEIKKSFRRLALRYHPDTNPGNQYAEAWYREIQEAYETLTDAQLREAYHEQRWLLKSQGKSFSETAPLTPQLILKQATELLAQVKQIDHFRMDHIALQQQILIAVDNERIEVLNNYRELAINDRFVQTIIDSMFPLEFPLLKPVLQQLKKINNSDKSTGILIGDYYQKRKRSYAWEKYQALIILIITLLLCAIIYLAA